ncbi:hypothetical protein LX99_02798 [Mucilaginibacter oryzae]|uniref:Uncharacterized protein n=1 Tax=Mucilaginibacter oryzae TaxID=468058 RepID=A0A316HCA5_9SPHI|nr:hypothetical protein [Mucilaginibacter oryzae]PWK77913.1 hypothetical protein LX99_02798 [Mucilaginibacter oryzae]
MKINTLLPAILLFICTACNNAKNDNTRLRKDITKSIPDDSTDLSAIKGSRGANLIDDIYANQLLKRPELRKLEDLIRHFDDGAADSLKQFDMYNGKSLEYYRSAGDLLLNIKDTVLRAHFREMIDQSRHKYQDTINQFSILVNHIDSNRIKVGDYHLALKLAVTLPIIERYQFESLPDLKSAANLANEAQGLKVKAMQMVSKNRANE